MSSDVDIDYRRMSRDDLVSEVERLNELLDEKEDTISILEDQIEDLEDDKDDLEEEVMENESPSSRRPPPHFKLPPERPGVTHKFHVGASELGHGYLNIGLYPDTNELAEIFIKMRKTSEDEVPKHLAKDPFVNQLNNQVNDLSAFLRGVLDQLGIAVSIGLQRGIPLETYASKYRGMRFPPDGMTRNPDVPHATSIVDYLFRYLGMKFIGTEEWQPPKRDA